MTTLRTLRLLALLGGLFAMRPAAAARAAQPAVPTADPTYQTECGSCHIAYPPRLLPRESWHALMANLSAHFGTDASLDAATTTAVLQYLDANARRSRPGAAPVPLRITEQRWFRHEHDEVPTSRWTSAAVKSPANCGACHPQAESGTFSERTLRLPQ